MDFEGAVFLSLDFLLLHAIEYYIFFHWRKPESEIRLVTQLLLIENVPFKKIQLIFIFCILAMEKKMKVDEVDTLLVSLISGKKTYRVFMCEKISAQNLSVSHQIF